MSDAVAGSVVAKLGYDTTGLKKGEREAEQSLKKVDENLATTGKNATRLGDHFSTAGKVIGTFAGIKLAGALTQGLETSIRQASDLNETISKTRVVFGDSFDAVDKFSQGAAKGLGESRQAAEEAAATYGNLFVSMGIGQQSAATMSTTLVQLAGDLASFNNTSTTDALDALKSGLVGEVEPLRRYGVALDDATLRQKALELGLVSSTQNALQPAVRTQAAYALILDKTKTAQGDFARTADGNANSLRTMQAETKDAEAALGQGLLPVQLSLVKAANDLLPAMQSVAGAISAIGSNDTARKTVEIVAGVAAALYGLNKAITISKAVRDSEIFSLLRGTAAREASTVAIVAEGRAAAAAATEVGALAAAEAGSAGGAAAGGAAAGGAGARGILAGVGGAALGGLSTLLLAGGDAPSLKQGDISKLILDIRSKQKNNESLPLYDQALKLHEGQPFVQSRGLDKSAAVQFLLNYGDDSDPKVRAALASLGYTDIPAPAAVTAPYGLTASGTAARRLANTQGALAKAHAGVSDVNALKAEQGIVGSTFGGAFDVLPSTQQGDVSGATDKLATANDRLKSAQDRLEQSQRRLTDLRATGKASTTQLADAEDRLAAARRNLDAASKNAGKAEDTLNKAKATTALSATDILGRVTGQAQHASGLASANNKLAASGLSKPVIEGIDQLEKEAPGTIARVAAGLTPAMVKALNAQFAKVQQAEHEFLTAPLRAAERAAQAENEKAAAAYAKSYANALARHWADLDLPAPGQEPFHGKSPQGRVLPTPAPADHEGRTAQGSTTYDLRGSTIVADDPTAMEAELARRARVSALAGRG